MRTCGTCCLIGVDAVMTCSRGLGTNDAVESTHTLRLYNIVCFL